MPINKLGKLNKRTAMMELWWGKLEMMGYEIGDSNGAFSDHDMYLFNVLESLVWDAQRKRIYTEMAQSLLSLFDTCDPNHRLNNDEDRVAYARMRPKMVKLAQALGDTSWDFIEGKTPTDDEEDF